MFNRVTLLKTIVFTLAIIPLVHLAWRTYMGALGANPVETLTHRTGDWSLRFLLLTLAITPVRNWTNWSDLIRIRRMLGLFTFFYASIHFSIWLVFDHFFDWGDIVKDILKRPYVTFGFLAFVLMIPLALTSNQISIRRLGKRWKSLHRTIYIIGAFAVFHYAWLVKADFREPLIYAFILLALYFVRTVWWQYLTIRWRGKA